jgi:hypothetical protein
MEKSGSDIDVVLRLIRRGPVSRTLAGDGHRTAVEAKVRV